MPMHSFLSNSQQLNQAFESAGSSGAGVTRRSFIKRSGGATVATVVGLHLTEYGYGNEPDHNDVVSYQYRLYVSVSPDVDDLVVSWMTSSNEEDRVEWTLTGSGPPPFESDPSQLTPITGTIASPFANGTESSTPQAKRNQGLYDGSWLTSEANAEHPVELHFQTDDSDALSSPEDESSTLKVNGAIISASLARATPVWTGATVAYGSTSASQVVYKTEDGKVFNTLGEAEAYLKSTLGANVTAAKITSSVKAEANHGITGKVKGEVTKTTNYDVTRDSSDNVTLTVNEVIDKAATGEIKAVWKIQLQRRTRTQRIKNDGTDEEDGAPEFSEWKMVQESNPPQE